MERRDGSVALARVKRNQDVLVTAAPFGYASHSMTKAAQHACPASGGAPVAAPRVGRGRNRQCYLHLLHRISSVTIPPS